MGDKNIQEIFATNIHKLRKSKSMTQGDLAEVLGVGVSTISDWEKAKKYPRAGVIEKISSYFGVAKNKLFEEQADLFDLYDSDDDVINLPIVGRVSCGNGITVFEEIDGYEETPKSWVRGGDHFYVRASGDSMINARIHDGDLLLIKKQDDVEDGEIAAITIDEQIFLKRVFKSNDMIILQSENSEIPPMFKTENDGHIRIIGKLKKIVIDM